jgi:hypothetical protein
MLNKDDHHQSSAQHANVQLELTPKCKGCPMGFRSPLVLMSAVGLFTLGFVAPWSATKAVADPSGDRLGCGTYCQNAGGYGGAGGNRPPPAVTLVSTNVTADADGYVPVTLRCHLQVQCMGVLLLTPVDSEGRSIAVPGATGGTGGGRIGRSDLLVNAGATRTIGVPEGGATLAYLRSHGPTPFSLTIDADQAPGCQDRHEGCGFANNDFSYTNENPLTVAAPG